MVLNLLKKYPDLLDIDSLPYTLRIDSLRGVFDHNITNNSNFKFEGKQIRPIKKEGESSMDTLFNHLIKKDKKNDSGKKTGSRVYEVDRSKRLHWIKHHIEKKSIDNILVFSYEDRIKGRGDVIRTYIYDKVNDYVIILEPQRSKMDYYLLTAYYFNEPGGKKQIKKKLKKKLSEIY